jgi:putative addiction module component (TIGR02574 family)
MGLTKDLTVQLSEEEFEFVRSKVRNGEFASEAEVVHDVISAARDEQVELEAWLRTEIAARYDGYKANPSSALTVEQLEASLAKKRRRRAALSA